MVRFDGEGGGGGTRSEVGSDMVWERAMRL